MKYIVYCLLAATLIACQAATPMKTAGDSTPRVESPANSDKAPLFHGFDFAENVEHFKRIRFENPGSEEAFALYTTRTAPGSVFKVSLYIYTDPRPGVHFKETFDILEVMMRSYLGDGETLEERAWDFGLNGMQNGQLRLQHYPEKQLVSGVWLGLYKGWIVKVRMTYSDHYYLATKAVLEEMGRAKELPFYAKDSGLLSTYSFMQAVNFSALQAAP